ncbi:carbohydrate ABC transporter permease [Paenibacillus sp. FSL H7-0331]|uniref:carbohydrate ABC transporter permease n=1 Tax=Paenibacillus sp. FSL H7-0331 TaxID=1920421 RepID=UPI00096FF5AF|nr:carbohydrate ABC transporter permease [Paenibacillus sp. FSL H7-0331]OMF11032.1 ABC transporter permease [Paenibacillus sp. FSL H7-0331]
MKLSYGERLFTVTNYLLLTIFGLLALTPFIHILAQSFSSYRAIMSGEVALWPVNFTGSAYQEVFQDAAFLQSFLVSVVRTVIGTVVNVSLSCLLAYPLSRSYIRGRNPIIFMMVFTMIFSGGMIPTYLLVKELGLLNSFWAYILPGALSAFNVIILKNFFQSVPHELEESARMDGCGNLGILFRIFIPLSMPAIATIALFHGVQHWNSFFDAILYMNNKSLLPLQVYLRNLIQFSTTDIHLNDALEQQMLALESIKGAAIIVSIIPMLLVYPWLQKYFVKGIMLGSVKG